MPTPDDRSVSRRAEAETRFGELLEVMHRLRHECPWDREQTHESIAPYLVEETYEVLEALEGDDDDELRTELGDLLLQVVFHAELASERDAFGAADVARAISEKLIRRHPHVFSDSQAASPEEVTAQWSRIKEEERRGKNADASALAGVPRAMPALIRAGRLGEKASNVGFDWPDVDGVVAKVDEEVSELREALGTGNAAEIEAELGDCLLALANLGRKLGLNAEMALRASSDRFESRFRHLESGVVDSGRKVADCTVDELEVLWQEAKKRLGEA